MAGENQTPSGNLLAIRNSIEALSALNAVATAGTKSTVASGTVSVTVLAANTSRKGACITNTDASVLYLDLSGGEASAISFSVLIPTNGYYEVPFGYTGLITGIWVADGAGSALVTEFI